MKKACYILAVTVLFTQLMGCRVRQPEQQQYQQQYQQQQYQPFPTGPQTTAPAPKKKNQSVGSDPFLGIDYSDDNVGRPDTVSYASPREAKPDPMDPMEQFFQQGGFANIMSNPTPPPMPNEAPQQQTPAPVTTPPVSQPAYPQPTQPTYTSPAPIQPAAGTFTPTTVAPTYNTAPSYQTPQPYTSSPSYSSPSMPMYSSAPIDSTPLAVTDSAPQHVSLIYPSPEYGIIKLDKIIAKEANVSQPFTYSIIVTNLTNTTLTSIVVTEEVGPNFQLGNVNPKGQRLENQIMWKIDTLGPKSNERIEISGVPTTMDPMRHNTSITYAIYATSNIHVVQPTLELARKVPSEALLCDLINIEYIVQNTGTGAARDVQIRESLPPGLLTENGNNVVEFDAGTLGAGQSRSFTARLRANRTGKYVNKAIAESSSNIRAESVATATIVRQPVLEVVKHGPPRLYLGRPASYEIQVINKGDGIARDAVLVDILPAGVTGVEASAGADITGSKLTWQLGSIPAGTAKTVRVTYKPANTGMITSTATVNAYCTEPVSTTISTSVIGIPAVRLSVVDLEDPVEVGGMVTYVLTVVNEGSAADRNIRLVCHMEQKLQYISASGPTQGSNMGSTINFGPLPSLAPGEKATWRVKARAAQPGGVRFRVTMGSDQLTRPVEQTEATFLYQ